MHLAPLFARVPTDATDSNLTMTPNDRLKHLRRLLLPQIGRSSIVTQRTVQSGRAESVNLEELRQLVFKGIPVTNSSHLRPLAWRVLLGIATGSPYEWADQLRCRRADYQRWKQDFVGGTPSSRDGGNVRSEDENRRDIFLMKEIEKDVSRTRSEIEFFSGGSIAQQQMLYILFIFAKLHPDVGYIQGMNEILAPILYVCSTDPSAVQAFDVEADAFHLFASVMASLKVLYGRSQSDPLKSGADVQLSRLAQLLRQHDATLWQHLNSVGLTPDLYSLRWYMTLMAREFPMPETLRIWDALLSDSKRFSFLHYVCCALVRSQRDHLLRDGFTNGLKRLQYLQSIDDEKLNIEQILLAAENMRQVDRKRDAQRNQPPTAANLHET